MAAPASDTVPPSFTTDPVRGSLGNGSTPSKILLGVGEHTIKVMRPGYKGWEQKIVVGQGSVKTFKAILEKQ